MKTILYGEIIHHQIYNCWLTLPPSKIDLRNGFFKGYPVGKGPLRLHLGKVV